MQKRETWWWNSTVQGTIARKKGMFKKWQQSKAQEDHADYKEAKSEARRTVAVERARYQRGISEHFEVGIDLHQGSALSPFQFIMLVDTLYQDVRTELPCELLYADDLAIIDITITDTQTRLESWQKVLTDSEDQCGKD